VGQYRAKRYKRYRKTSEEKEEEDKIEEAYGIEWMDILLDIRNYKNKYNYILLTKQILEEIGVNKPGIYRFTLETPNGEKIEIFREISKIGKHVLIIPKRYSDAQYVKLIDFKEYTLEKIIKQLGRLNEKRNIDYKITKENDTLYLHLQNYRMRVERYGLKAHSRALYLDVNIKITPMRTLTLRINIHDDNPELLVKRGKEKYTKIVEIKSTKKTASLAYYDTKKRGVKTIQHINIVSMEYYKKYSELIRQIVKEIDGYDFLKVWRGVRVYEYKLTDIGKNLIDYLLDKIYKDYYIERKGFGQEAKEIKEDLGMEIASNFLTSMGWEYKEKYIIDPSSRKGFDLLAVKDNIGYLFEVKITEPSFRNKAIKRAMDEIRKQAYKMYREFIDTLYPKIGYIGFIVITFHYSWRSLNEYKVYFWVERYEKR